MKQFDELEDLFENVFRDFEETPPIDVKAAIDEQLFSTRPRVGIWYFWLNIFMLVFFIGLIYHVQLKNDTHTNDRVSETKDLNPTVNMYPQNSTEHETYEANSGINKRTQVSAASLAGHDFKHSTQRTSEEGKPLKFVGQTPGFLKTSDSKNGKDDRIDDPLAMKSVDGNDVEFVQKETEDVPKIETPQIQDPEVVLTNEAVKSMDVEDSIPDLNQQENELPTILPDKRTRHYFQIIAGVSGAFGQLKNDPVDRRLTLVQPAWEFGGEFGFGMSENLSLSTGLTFSRYQEKFAERTSYISDSSFVGVVEVIYFDTISQTNDTMFVAQYSYTEEVSWKEQTFQVSSFNVPLYATWILNRESDYEISLTGGIRMQFNTMKIVSGQDLGAYATVRDLNVGFMLRPQFIYFFDKLGVGAYTQFTRDLKPALIYQDQSRNRWLLGGGMFLRYAF